jgi:hypothetical protein
LAFFFLFFFFARDICIIHSSIHSNVKCVCNCWCCRSGWGGGRFLTIYIRDVCIPFNQHVCCFYSGMMEKERVTYRLTFDILCSESCSSPLWSRRSIIWKFEEKNYISLIIKYNMVSSYWLIHWFPFWTNFYIRSEIVQKRPLYGVKAIFLYG